MSTNKEDEYFSNWQRWLRDDLSHQFGWLVRSMQVFNAWCDMFGQPEHIGSDAARDPATIGVLRWITSNYFESACVAIRRQIDTHGDSISLHRLLSDMEEHVEVLTSQNLAKHNPRFRHVESEAQDPVTAMSPVLAEEKRWMREISAKVQRFVNKSLAHRDEKKYGAVIPSIDELTTAIKGLYYIYCKYASLIAGMQVNWEEFGRDYFMDVPIEEYRVKFDLMLRALMPSAAGVVNRRPLGGPAIKPSEPQKPDDIP